MKNTKFISVFLLVIPFLLVTSCKKSNLNDYPDFQGDWYGSESSTNYEITIDSYGNASYIKTNGTTTATFTGRLIVKNEDDELKIGIKKFDIDQYPKEAGGDWGMTLDGIDYYKY